MPELKPQEPNVVAYYALLKVRNEIDLQLQAIAATIPKTEIRIGSSAEAIRRLEAKLTLLKRKP